MVAEEAGQILEAHILASLVPSVQVGYWSEISKLVIALTVCCSI